jgi:hypothetical protein
VAAVLAALAAAGCSDSPDDAQALPTFTAPEASASGGASASPSAAASSSAASSGGVTVTLADGSSAKAGDVLPAFQGYLVDMAAAMADPDNPPRSLWALASAQTLIDNRAERLAKDDERITGPITVTATIRLSGRRATVEGCLDQSKVRSERAGKRVTLDEPKRLPVLSTLRGSGKTWLVESFSVPTSRSC